MKKRIQGLFIGLLIGAVFTSGIAYAVTGSKYIEVIYNNIKVYKDNVLCELKDSNGTVIEPFIYNGTTYMPVRGTANLADMEVTWNGSTQSVYLWDEMTPNGTYLLDVCPPYEKSYEVDLFHQSQGKTFSMAGEKYSNGFSMQYSNQYALFNLNSKYSNIEFTVGHYDTGTSKWSNDQTVTFFVDGKVVKEITIGAEDMPKTISVPVQYGLQLKIMTGDTFYSYIGFGNVTVR